MNVTIELPAALRRFTDDVSKVSVEAGTVSEALARLLEQHPKLRQTLYTSDGQRRGYVRVYVNSRDIRELDGDTTRVSPGDSILLVPAIAGG